MCSRFFCLDMSHRFFFLYGCFSMIMFEILLINLIIVSFMFYDAVNRQTVVMCSYSFDSD